MNKIIRIGTRKSALAVVQAQIVADALINMRPGLSVELVLRQTEGDRIQDKPLLEFGGKGVFVSEFEEALLKNAMDFAVHSAKDLPMELEEGLGIVAVLKREDPRDVLITAAGTCLGEKTEIVIGTSSLRRKIQIEELGKDMWPGVAVRCENLRGNIQTRLGKLDEGQFDAIILAAAGLKRMGIEKEESHDFHYFDCEDFIPAGGQGILAVEGRLGDRIAELGVEIQDRDAAVCFRLERRILKLLQAGCHEPIGVYSRIVGGKIEVFGINRRGSDVKKIHIYGEIDETELLAKQAAKGLS